MRYGMTCTSGLALFITLAASSPAQTHDVAGEWDLSIETPQGFRRAGMTLRQDGETLQGVFKGERGELPFEGKITGSTIMVSYTVDFGGNEITIMMTGEVEGEDVRGQGDFGGFAKFDWSGNRTARLPVIKEASAVNIPGEWDLKVQTPQGTREVRAMFESEDGRLAGKLMSPLGELPLTGTITGNRVEFSYVIQFQDNELPITMSGTVHEDSMTGTADFGGLAEGDWTGIRLAGVAVPTVDLSGEWELTINSPQGSRDVRAMFESEGEQLSGKLMSPLGELPFAGTLTGNQVEFSYVIQFQDNELPITMSGTVHEDSMTGTADFGGLAEGDWTGIRLAGVAVPTVDLSGEWELTINSPQGSRDVRAMFESEGEQLSGKLMSPLGELPFAGTLTGNQVEFSYVIQFQDNELPITMSGTVHEDSMTGTADFGGLAEGDWTGIRLAGVAVPTVDLSGEWELTINSPQGSRDVRAMFESEGEQLSGKLMSPLGELPFAGTLTGNQVEFSYVIQFQDNEVPITMSGIVEGDEMTGDADFGGLAQGEWTGQRLESPETVPDLSGSWDVTIHSPQGRHEVRAMLHSGGARLTGTLVGDDGEVPLEGMIDGNQIRFSYVIQFQDNQLPITITGEVKGDTMEGEADFGGFAQGNWSAARSAGVMDAGNGNLNSAADVTGEWIFEVETDLGSGSPVFKLIQEGESLRGTYSGIFGQSELQGKVRGNEIRFSFPISGQGIEGTVVYTGTIEEDVMQGTASVGDLGEATWKARRHP